MTKRRSYLNFFFFFGGGGEGRGEGGYAQGGPNLPTPILSSLASSHTPFPLRDIKHCWVISPYFSLFLPFQNFHISLFSLPPPIPFRPFSSGLKPPVLIHLLTKLQTLSKPKKKKKWQRKRDFEHHSFWIKINLKVERRPFSPFFLFTSEALWKKTQNTEDFHLYKDEQRKQMNNQTSAPPHPTNPFHMTQSQRWTKLRAVTT